MKLVVDANILFSLFKKASFTRRFILSHPEIEIFTPIYVFEELEEHTEEVKSKAKIDDRIFELSQKEFPDDVEYLAVALSLGCAIWSNDRDLKEKQYRVVVITTEELAKLSGNSTNLS
jgi:predicted nucleic acid-binding protein